MNLDEVQSNLGYSFNNEELLIEALTHSSCLNEPSMGLNSSNEALAWLGDAVVYWVMSENLYNPELSKECLTDVRKKYIEAKYQADQALRFGLDIALFMPMGQEKLGGRKNRKNLHTVYEAVIGAIYRDRGLDEAKKFVLDQIENSAPA